MAPTCASPGVLCWGYIIGDFNADIATKLGVPVEYGTRLSDVVDGMGAQKAGLQKNDVIIAIDGHELTIGTTLGSVVVQNTQVM